MPQGSPRVNARRLLLAAAAPAEAKAAFDGLRMGISEPPPPWTVVEAGPGFDLVLTGIGKANAAGAVARVLDPGRHSGVLSIGVAGALPGSGLRPGAVVLGSQCVYADEGLATPEGFVDCARLGFPLGQFPGSSVPVDPTLTARLRPLVENFAPIATVSTCSGTDALAAQVVERTGAVAEAMEGAAVVQTALRLGVAGAEVRAISNTTGDRHAQFWDLKAGLAALSRVLGLLAAKS